MRAKRAKARIRHNAWKREMRYKYGPNWRSEQGIHGVYVEEQRIELIPKPKSIEDIRKDILRLCPPAVRPAYTEGVSPNASY